MEAAGAELLTAGGLGGTGRHGSVRDDTCVSRRRHYGSDSGDAVLAIQFAEELLLVHVVFERFAAVNKDDGNLVVELAAEFGIGVHINLAPGEAAVAREFGQAFFDDFAEMATFAGIDDYTAGHRHAKKILSRGVVAYQSVQCGFLNQSTARR